MRFSLPSFLSAALLLIAVVSILCFRGEAAAQDHGCPGDETRFIDKRGGTQNGAVPYNYESRVEKYSPTARRYIWCINNTSKYLVAEFKWGISAELKDWRYFSAFVEPGKTSPSIQTDGSKIKNDLRYIGSRRTNSDHWAISQADTIFSHRIGYRDGWENLLSGDPIKKAQFQSDRGTTVDFDLEAASKSPDELRYVIAKLGGKTGFHSEIVATLPTNLKTLRAIEDNTYDKYDRRDFVRAYFGVYYDIRLVDGKPVSNFSYALNPERSNDQERLDEALKAISFRVKLLPLKDTPTTTIPRELYLDVSLPKSGYRNFFEQPAENFTYVSAILSVTAEESKRELVSLPVELPISQHQPR